MWVWNLYRLIYVQKLVFSAPHVKMSHTLPIFRHFYNSTPSKSTKCQTMKGLLWIFNHINNGFDQLKFCFRYCFIFNLKCLKSRYFTWCRGTDEPKVWRCARKSGGSGLGDTGTSRPRAPCCREDVPLSRSGHVLIVVGGRHVLQLVSSSAFSYDWFSASNSNIFQSRRCCISYFS